MDSMFSGAASFSGDLSTWDVGNVANMHAMFAHNRIFSGDLSNWDVGSVTDTTFMFYNTNSFCSDLTSWDISGAIITSIIITSMFNSANNFDEARCRPGAVPGDQCSTPCPTASPTAPPTGIPTSIPTSIPTTAGPSVPPTANPSEAPTAGPSSHACDAGTHGCDSEQGICLPLLSPSTGYQCSCADTYRCSDGNCLTVGHTCLPTDRTLSLSPTASESATPVADTVGSDEDDGSDNSPLLITLIVALVGCGVCVVGVKLRRSNNPTASRKAGVTANPTYAGLGPAVVVADFTTDANSWLKPTAAADSGYAEIRPLGAGDADAGLEGSYGQVGPLLSRGSRAGSTSSSTFHLKVDDNLYGGLEEKDAYIDVAPLAGPEEDV